MGQEAYAMFPALAQMSANAKLANAQAGNVGQELAFLKQQYGDRSAAEGAFGNAGVAGGFGESPQVRVPGGQQLLPAPQPGQASQPAAGFQPFKPRVPGVRIPQVGGPAMKGPVNTGPEDTVGERPADLPQAAQPPAPRAQAEGAPHAWTPGPGEQYDTPDGSRPRSLDEVFGALKKANPTASPATIARAAAMYLPWMTEADQIETRKAIAANTAAIHASDAESRRRMEEFRQGEITDRNTADNVTKKELAYANMNLREKLAKARSDDRYKELVAKQENWEQKIDIAKQQLELGTNSLAQKALIAAQRAKHDAVYNLVSTMYSNGDMTDEEKATIQQQADQELEDAKAMGSGAPKAGGEAKIRTQKEAQPLRVPRPTESFPDPGGASRFQ